MPAMTLRLPAQLQDRVKVHAEYFGLSSNAVIRLALINYLDFHEARRKPARAAQDTAAEGRPANRAQEDVPKLGVNELCHCGSGRKYKRCHMREDEQRRRGGP